MRIVAKALTALFVACGCLLSSAPAQAVTLPLEGKYYFVGDTETLFRIRAAIDHLVGFGPDAWTFPAAYANEWSMFPPPFGMGEVDCLDSFYAPGQGPYDGSEDYLGMSTTVVVGGVSVGVEIPALEDLVALNDVPGECYGYLFATYCGTAYMAALLCQDPVP